MALSKDTGGVYTPPGGTQNTTTTTPTQQDTGGDVATDPTQGDAYGRNWCAQKGMDYDPAKKVCVPKDGFTGGGGAGTAPAQPTPIQPTPRDTGGDTVTPITPDNSICPPGQVFLNGKCQTIEKDYGSPTTQGRERVVRSGDVATDPGGSSSDELENKKWRNWCAQKGMDYDPSIPDCVEKGSGEKDDTYFPDCVEKGSGEKDDTYWRNWCAQKGMDYDPSIPDCVEKEDGEDGNPPEGCNKIHPDGDCLNAKWRKVLYNGETYCCPPSDGGGGGEDGFADCNFKQFDGDCLLPGYTKEYDTNGNAYCCPPSTPMDVPGQRPEMDWIGGLEPGQPWMPWNMKSPWSQPGVEQAPGSVQVPTGTYTEGQGQYADHFPGQMDLAPPPGTQEYQDYLTGLQGQDIQGQMQPWQDTMQGYSQAMTGAEGYQQDIYQNALQEMATTGQYTPETEQALISAVSGDVEQSYQDAESDLMRDMNDMAQQQGVFGSDVSMANLQKEYRKLQENKAADIQKGIADIRFKGQQLALQSREQQAGAAQAGGQLGLGGFEAGTAERQRAQQAGGIGGEQAIASIQAGQQQIEQQMQQAVAAGQMSQEDYNQVLSRHESLNSTLGTWGQLSNEDKKMNLDNMLGNKSEDIKAALGAGQLDLETFNAEVAQNLGISAEQLKARGLDIEAGALMIDYALSTSRDMREWQQIKNQAYQWGNEFDMLKAQGWAGILIQLFNMF